MVAYRKRAEECRKLAEVRAGTEHWAAFLEMAETWDKLTELRELGRTLKASGVLVDKPGYTQTKFDLSK